MELNIEKMYEEIQNNKYWMPANTNKKKAQFHYFDEAGLIAEWNKNNEKINKLVDAGKVKTGWLLAYGMFADDCAKRIIKLAMRKRVSTIQVNVAIEMLEDQIKKQNEKIASVA